MVVVMVMVLCRWRSWEVLSCTAKREAMGENNFTKLRYFIKVEKYKFVIIAKNLLLIRYVDTSEKMNKIFAGVEAALA